MQNDAARRRSRHLPCIPASQHHSPLACCYTHPQTRCISTHPHPPCPCPSPFTLSPRRPQVWCCYKLGDTRRLAVSRERLKRAREGLARAHGPHLERLRGLTGSAFTPELATWVAVWGRGRAGRWREEQAARGAGGGGVGACHAGAGGMGGAVGGVVRCRARTVGFVSEHRHTILRRFLGRTHVPRTLPAPAAAHLGELVTPCPCGATSTRLHMTCAHVLCCQALKSRRQPTLSPRLPLPRYLRLEVLEGLAAYHGGEPRATAEACLRAAQAKWQRLQVRAGVWGRGCACGGCGGCGSGAGRQTGERTGEREKGTGEREEGG